MPVKPIINQDYVLLLKKNCDELTQLCSILNNSPAFQQKVNTHNSNTQSSVSIKAEHIVLQDLINLYYRSEKLDANNSNAKSKFTLAYYYESLKNGASPKPASIDEINTKIHTQSFENKIKEVTQSVSNNFNTPAVYLLLKEINSDHLKEMVQQYFNFVNNILKSDDVLNPNEEKLLNEVLGPNSTHTFYNNEIENDTLELAMADLNKLIGLKEAKTAVNNIINYLQIQKAREKEKLPQVSHSLHSVFIGPPGTGKTSVARILSRIYKHIGLLEKGHLVETDRAGLVAGYVGQTALKVDEVINKALGGVLFIDEAYTLASENSLGSDYGKEALEILLKRMEDYRDKFIVIVAGYPDEMKAFIESNPGLKSRFNQYINFDHYNPKELMEIFKSFCTKYAFKLSADAEEKISDIFEMADDKKTESYGNAREARNLFEHIVRLQSNRLVNQKDINAQTLSEIREEDVPPVKETSKKMTAYGPKD